MTAIPILSIIGIALFFFWLENFITTPTAFTIVVIDYRYIIFAVFFAEVRCHIGVAPFQSATTVWAYHVIFIILHVFAPPCAYCTFFAGISSRQ